LKSNECVANSRQVAKLHGGVVDRVILELKKAAELLVKKGNNAMGNPLHFSAELPQRCLQLIEDLWPHVEKTRQVDRPDLGPLTTTFLISMSMPIINLPIERIERHKNARTEGYADDRSLDPKVAKVVLDTLGGQRLSKAPFYLHGEWSFAIYANNPLFNLARSIPDDLATELGSEQAAAKASNMPVSQWCSILRNAMAHGGIAYLNEGGRTSYGEPVKMYGFVSGKFDDVDYSKLLQLNVLRISETNYRKFLSRWVAWLKSSGLARELTAA
jgi:hypothetical protein